MSGNAIRRSKIQTLSELITLMYSDFQSLGFTSVLPQTGSLTLTEGAGKFVLESSAAVNVLNEQQPYRILVETFESEGGLSMRIAVANPQQISDTGNVTSFPYDDEYVTVNSNKVLVPYEGQHVMGSLGLKFSPAPYNESGNYTITHKPGLKRGDVFIARDGVRGSNFDEGNTISYLISATPRGVMFYAWHETSDTAPLYSFFCVQSPVNKDTGAPLTDLNSPIFCVYDCDNTGPKRFVVSEADTFRPTRSTPADKDTINSSRILNSEEQVAIKKGNLYVVMFPNRLNTERYVYTEELDMIAYTSADVIGEDTSVPVSVYEEETARTYRALKSNGPNNTKMRLLMLVDGGGSFSGTAPQSAE